MECRADDGRRDTEIPYVGYLADTSMPMRTERSPIIDWRFVDADARWRGKSIW